MMKVPGNPEGPPTPEDAVQSGCGAIRFSRIGECPSVLVARLEPNRGWIGSLDDQWMTERILNAFSGFRHIIVDMTSVTYLVSSAFGGLTKVLKQARDAGGELILTGVDSKIHQIFDLVGFTSFVMFAKSMEEAEYLVSDTETLKQKRREIEKERQQAVRLWSYQKAESDKTAESDTVSGLPPLNISRRDYEELCRALETVDQLLEQISQDAIAAFARSEFFESYKYCFEELGISEHGQKYVTSATGRSFFVLSGELRRRLVVVLPYLDSLIDQLSERQRRRFRQSFPGRRWLRVQRQYGPGIG